MTKLGPLFLHKTGYYACRFAPGKFHYFKPRGMSESEAQVAYAKFCLEHHQATNANKSPDDETIAVLFGLHLDRVKGTTSEKNYSDKKGVIESFITLHGAKPIKEITPLQVDDFINNRPVRSTGGGKRNAFAHLACAFNWCNRKCKVTSAPHKDATRPPEHPRAEEYVIEPEEYHKIHALMRQPYADALQVLWESGCRPSECLEATVEEYRPESHCLVKRQHKTRHLNQERVILLTGGAESIIRSHIGDRKEGYIFQTKKGKPLSERWMNESFILAAEKVGRTKPTVLYSTRHSFAVKHLKRLRPINIVAGWLGHDVTTCQRTYAHTLLVLQSLPELLTA